MKGFVLCGGTVPTSNQLGSPNCDFQIVEILACLGPEDGPTRSPIAECTLITALDPLIGRDISSARLNPRPDYIDGQVLQLHGFSYLHARSMRQSKQAEAGASRV